LSCIETTFTNVRDTPSLTTEDLQTDSNAFGIIVQRIVVKETFFDIIDLVEREVERGNDSRHLLIYPILISFYLGAVKVLVDNKDQVFERVYKILLKLQDISIQQALYCYLQTGCVAEQFKHLKAPSYFELAIRLLEDFNVNEYESIKRIISSLSKIELEDDLSKVFINSTSKFVQRMEDHYLKGELYCDCSMALFNENRKEEKLSISFLQKAMKESGLCQTPEKNLMLFVKILNVYCVEYIEGNNEITSTHINNLLSALKSNLEKQNLPEIQAFYEQTINDLKSRNSDKIKELVF